MTDVLDMSNDSGADRRLPARSSVSDPFADFYRAHYPGAVRLAWLLTHDHGVTDDIVQNAFIRLRARFDGIDDRPAYLRACVVNGCRDHARSTDRRRSRVRLVAAGQPLTSHDHPSELVDAVAALPHKQRVAIVLRYWADLPEHEIASILGVRPGTVRTIVARALTTLRKDVPR